jgi:hypothetical protein
MPACGVGAEKGGAFGHGQHSDRPHLVRSEGHRFRSLQRDRVLFWQKVQLIRHCKMTAISNRRGLFACIVGSLAWAIAFGCSKAPKLPTVPVSGTVTLDGQPLDGANVAFSPVDLDGKPANATTDSQGAFRLKTYIGASFGQADGALPGEYTVMVSKYEAQSGTAPTSDEIEARQTAMQEAQKTGKPLEQIPTQPKLLTPEKYCNPKDSGLKATVKSSDNTPFTFDLKSQESGS